MEPPVNPAEQAPLAESAVEPQQESWQGPSQDEWNDYLQFRDQVNQAQAEYEQQLAQQQEQGAQQPAIEWLDEDSQAQLDRYLEQRLEQRLGPIQQVIDQQALQEGDQRAQDILNDLVARDGDFLLEGSREKARALANTYFPEMAQRHGYGTSMWNPQRAGEAALEQAAKDVREWEQAVGRAYYEREVNQLRGLAGAPREPGAGSPAAGQSHMVGGLGNRPNAVTSKFFGGQP